MNGPLDVIVVTCSLCSCGPRPFVVCHIYYVETFFRNFFLARRKSNFHDGDLETGHKS